MCGIAGYIGKNNLNLENLKNTSDILNHRGPDGFGFYNHNYKDKNISFVHRRLSIIDLDNRSSQPFKFRSKVIIFNGEIYNHIEIRKDLESLGHVFNTSGDTEVLVHAICHWGLQALDKLEGMWAFALYDENDGTLILSRDRFGEKPLYIWQKDEGLYFSSEIKGFYTLTGEWPDINQNYLLESVAKGYKFLNKGNENFFMDVNQLQAGTNLYINYDGSVNTERYWKPHFAEDPNLSYDDSIALIKDAVIKSLRLRIRSDVPIAFCMSGGVDSNTLISIASKVLGMDVHGFTITNKDSRYEEQDLVNTMTNKIDIQHTEIFLTKENFLLNMRSMVRAHDAPVATISYYVHYFLMREIKEKGFKISMSGTGADEIFSGYYDHHLLYLASIFQEKELLEISKKNWKDIVKPHVRNNFLKDPKIFIEYPHFRDHIYSEDDFGDYFYNPILSSFFEAEYPVSLLRKRMLNELFYETVPVILNQDDKNAMHYSIENRSPFLDRNLFEESIKIPTKFLIHNGRAKSVLREAMRGIVPDAILDNNRKVGFNAPIEDLLDMKNKINRDQILDDSLIFNYIKKKEIEKILDLEKLPNSISKFLFSFIGAKFFLEEFSK